MYVVSRKPERSAPPHMHRKVKDPQLDSHGTPWASTFFRIFSNHMLLVMNTQLQLQVCPIVNNIILVRGHSAKDWGTINTASRHLKTIYRQKKLPPSRYALAGTAERCSLIGHVFVSRTFLVVMFKCQRTWGVPYGNPQSVWLILTKAHSDHLPKIYQTSQWTLSLEFFDHGGSLCKTNHIHLDLFQVTSQ